MSLLEELWRVVRSIPKGRVSAYGQVGAALRQPATGRMVGRWMSQAPQDVPWWRVVAKTGAFPITKRDPYLGLDQRRLLESEGVTFDGERVDMSVCAWEPDPD